MKFRVEFTNKSRSKIYAHRKKEKSQLTAMLQTCFATKGIHTQAKLRLGLVCEVPVSVPWPSVPDGDQGNVPDLKFNCPCNAS
jgi:hypothetical protein